MAEHLRWFDYWLKGIDNGIMDEPPMYLRRAWARRRRGMAHGGSVAAAQTSSPRRFTCAPGPSGSVASVNDGLLSSEAAHRTPAGRMTTWWTIRPPPAATTRWTDGYGGGYGYPDMTANDEKALTYTTPPLEAGHSRSPGIRSSTCG